MPRQNSPWPNHFSKPNQNLFLFLGLNLYPEPENTEKLPKNVTHAWCKAKIVCSVHDNYRHRQIGWEKLRHRSDCENRRTALLYEIIQPSSIESKQWSTPSQWTKKSNADLFDNNQSVKKREEFIASGRACQMSMFETGHCVFDLIRQQSYDFIHNLCTTFQSLKSSLSIWYNFLRRPSGSACILGKRPENYVVPKYDIRHRIGRKHLMENVARYSLKHNLVFHLEICGALLLIDQYQPSWMVLTQK